MWLTAPAAAGTTRTGVKMAEAVTTAKLVGAGDVDWALGHAAVHARFAEADLGSILDHHAHAQPGTGGPRRSGSRDRHRAGLTTATGQFLLALDIRQGRSRAVGSGTPRSGAVRCCCGALAVGRHPLHTGRGTGDRGDPAARRVRPGVPRRWSPRRWRWAPPARSARPGRSCCVGLGVPHTKHARTTTRSSAIHGMINGSSPVDPG